MYNHCLIFRQYGDRFCETCEVGFYQLGAFRHHLANHERCPYCGFAASVECLSVHVTNEHLLLKNIDVDNYIRERKKRFCTVQRRELAIAVQKQSRKRGELLGLKDSGVYAKYSGTRKQPFGGNRTGEQVDPSKVDSKEFEPLDVAGNKGIRRGNKRPIGRPVGRPDKRHKLDARCSVHCSKPFVDPFAHVIYVRPIPPFLGIARYAEDEENVTSLPSAKGNKIDQEQSAVNSTCPVLDISDDEDDYFMTSNVDVESDSKVNSCASNSSNTASGSSTMVEFSIKSAAPEANLIVKSSALSLLIGGYDSDQTSSDDVGADCQETSKEIPIQCAKNVEINDNHMYSNVVTPSNHCGKKHTLTSIVKSKCFVNENDDVICVGKINSDNVASLNSGRQEAGEVKLHDEDTGSSVSETDAVACRPTSAGNTKKKKRRWHGRRGSKRKINKIGKEPQITPSASPSKPEPASQSTSNKTNFKESNLITHKNSTTENTSENETSFKLSSTNLSDNPDKKSVIYIGGRAPHLIPINKKTFPEVSDDDAIPDQRSSNFILEKENKLASVFIERKYRAFKAKYKVPLLTKLLKDDIQYERNVLLQCAKYIADNNFFEQSRKLGDKLSVENSNDGTSVTKVHTHFEQTCAKNIGVDSEQTVADKTDDEDYEQSVADKTDGEDSEQSVADTTDSKDSEQSVADKTDSKDSEQSVADKTDGEDYERRSPIK